MSEGISLNSDALIREKMLAGEPIIVVGFKSGGKTSCAARISKTAVGYTVIDIAPGQEEKGYLEIVDAVQKKRKFLVFATSHFIEHAKHKYKSDNKTGLFDSVNPSTEVIVFTRDEAEALCRLFLSAAMNQTKTDTLMKKGVIDTIIKRSLRKENGKETYIPGLIYSFIGRLNSSGSIKASQDEVLDARLKEEEVLINKHWEHGNYVYSALGLSIAPLMVENTLVANDSVSLFTAILSKTPALAAIPAIAFGASTAGFGVIGVGIMVDLYRRHKRKNDSMLKYLAGASEHWKELSEEEKQIVGYEFEKKNDLAPGTGYSSLNNLFGSGVSRIQSIVAEYLNTNPDAWDTFVKSPAGKAFTDSIMDTAISKFDSHLQEIESTLTRYDQELVKIQQELAALTERVTTVERVVESLSFQKTLLSRETLEQQLSLIPVSTSPEISASLSMKVDKIITLLSERKKVVILGEAGVGKSTVLKIVCARLLDNGERLYTFGFGGLLQSDIFIADDLGRKVKDVLPLSQRGCRVLATSRLTDWPRVDRTDWAEVTISREDYEPFGLEQMLTKMLTSKGVMFSPPAVKIAVQKGEGLPVYLSALTSMAVQSGKGELTAQLAEASPSNVYSLIAEIIRGIHSEVSLGILSVIAVTAQGRIHQLHAQELESLLKQGLDGSSDEALALTEKQGSLLYLQHNMWLDVLKSDWRSLGISEAEPEGLKKVRSLDLQRTLLTAIDMLVERLQTLKPREAAEAAYVSLENNLQLVPRLLQIGLDTHTDLRGLLLEMVAVRAGKDVERAVDAIDPKKCLEIVKETKGAPSFKVIMCSRVIRAMNDAPVNTENLETLGYAFYWLSIQDVLEAGKRIAALRDAISIFKRLNDGDQSYSGLIGAMYYDLEGLLAKNIPSNEDNPLDDIVEYVKQAIASGDKYAVKLQAALDKLATAKTAEDYEECVMLALGIFQEMADTGRVPHVLAGVVFMNAGKMFIEMHRADKALKVLKDGLRYGELAVKADPDGNAVLAEILLTIGDAHQSVNNIDEAVEHFKKAISAVERLQSAFADFPMAMLHFKIGSAYASDNRRDAAAVEYLKAEGALRRLLLTDPTLKVSLAGILSDEGMNLKSMNNLEGALWKYGEAATLFDELSMSDKTLLTWAENSHYQAGVLLQMLQRDADALPHYEDAIQTIKEQEKEREWHAGEVYGKMAVAYYQTENSIKAAEACKRALEIAEPLIGTDEERTLFLANMNFMMAELGATVKEILPPYEKGLVLMRLLCSVNKKHTGRLKEELTDLVSILRDAGDAEAAKKYEHELTSIP